MYDIFYLGHNTALKENFPFAKDITNVSEATPRTKMFWLIEPGITVTDESVFSFKPSSYDEGYEHIWKWSHNNYGGVRLLPNNKSAGIKNVNQIVCKKTFAILSTPTPGTYFDDNPYATHVWCVDEEYKIQDDINWAPDNFEPTFIHSFHLKGQLEHKYPDKEGGIKLYPKDWKNASMKYHSYLDASLKYPYIFTKDPADYSQRDKFDDDYVWLVDAEYAPNVNTFDWVPNPFEEEYVHNFRMPYQLTQKYPEAMGGIYLVPKDWKDAELKVHKDCPIEDENYDVFYTNKAFTSDTFDFYAQRSESEWFWVIDREYDFNGKLLYVPEEHEREYIHIFKWGLEDRYDPSVVEVWDSRVGGIYLVNKNYDPTKKKLHTETVPIRYDIYFTDDLTDYDKFARKSRTEAFWLVDSEHQINEVLSWIPPYSEQKYINIFKIPKQLEHKYPSDITNVSDNRAGGLKLVPKDFNRDDAKYQGFIEDIEIVEYERFTSEEEGREKTKHDWFWVIDPAVDVLEDFDFEFTPEPWDEGKTHVWQKRNPETHLAYDYGGVKLCPKVPISKGRPKYIKEIACSQRHYPVNKLTVSDNIMAQLEWFDAEAKELGCSMFYVREETHKLVQPSHAPKSYDYYPSQWDEKNVHIFKTQEGDYRGLYLFPTGTFAKGHAYTVEDIDNHNFTNLKLISTEYTRLRMMRHHKLNHMTYNEITDILALEHEPYAFLLDSSSRFNSPEGAPIAHFCPKLADASKVHVWQQLNPHTDTVHSYGGLRLWPTAMHDEPFSMAGVKTNQLVNIQYVQKPGSYYEPYPIVLISYYEQFAQESYDRLKDRFPDRDIEWIRNVDGIFNAHKAAANYFYARLDETVPYMFWVVDADAVIADDFNFDYIPPIYDQEATHVWTIKNPVTGDSYGYGGVKLFNTAKVQAATTWGLDFTTGLGKDFKVMPQICGTSAFNNDSYSTWRSGFREAVKLVVNGDPESIQRLSNWLNPLEGADFASDAALGAQMGREYALKHLHSDSDLALINDYDELRKYYTENVG